MPNGTLWTRIISDLSFQEYSIHSYRQLVRDFPEVYPRFLEEGILRESKPADGIPMPNRYRKEYGLTSLEVRYTSTGIIGMPDPDAGFSGLDLLEDDVRQYEVSIPNFLSRLQKENGIKGTSTPQKTKGRYYLGDKKITGMGIVDIFIEFPIREPDSFKLRCLEWGEDNPSSRKSIVLTMKSIPMDPPVRQKLEKRNIFQVALLSVMKDDGTLAIDWENLFPKSQDSINEYDESDSIFRIENNLWFIVFKGKKVSPLPNSKGLEYIHLVLQSRDGEVSSTILRHALDSNSNLIDIGSEGQHYDEKGIENCMKRLDEIRMELKEAEQKGHTALINELKQEQEQILKEIEKSKKKDIKKVWETDRKNVSNRINESLKKIKDANEDLWKHFKAYLKLGYYVHYHPEPGIPWITQ